MEKKKKIVISIGAAVLIAILIAMKFHSTPAVTIERNDKITPTPNIITEVKMIGKWEFLSVKIEELVDTTKGVLFKDQLSALYTGTLRYGIDFSKAESNWFVQNGDTVVAFLPKVELLDDYFLDETATKTVFETGSFTSNDRQDMRERAIRQILAKSKKAGYENEAQAESKEQFARFLQNLGIKNIIFMDRY